MHERRTNIIVGATALAGIIGLLALMLLFGYFPQWAESTYEVHVRLPSAYGLGKDARVYLSGFDVGRVSRIRLDENGRGVIVTCKIDEKYRLPDDVHVELSSSVLGGGATMQFVMDRVDGGPVENFLPTDGSAVVYGESASPVGVFAKELRGALAGPLSRFDDLANSFERLSDEWQKVGENLNAITQQRSTEQVDAGEAEGNLATMVARADRRLAEMQQVLDGINRYVNDEQLYDDITTTISSTRKTAESMSSSITALEERYVALADDMSKTVGTLNEVLEKANRGEGTVGKLLTDADLYNNLNDAAERLNLALEELQLLFQKMKDEGLKFKL